MKEKADTTSMVVETAYQALQAGDLEKAARQFTTLFNQRDSFKERHLGLAICFLLQGKNILHQQTNLSPELKQAMEKLDHSLEKLYQLAGSEQGEDIPS